MARTPKVYVKVNGPKEFQQALALAKGELRKEMLRDLGQFGEGVAARAREIAEEKGLVRTRRLLLSIEEQVVGSSVIIGDSAVNPRDSYPYPGRFEFGDYDKPFLQPALAESEEEGVRRMVEVAERVIRTIVKKFPTRS